MIKKITCDQYNDDDLIIDNLTIGLFGDFEFQEISSY